MTRSPTRRQLLGALGLATAAPLLPLRALAQQGPVYPNRPIRLLHGFAAGGNADAVARILGASLTQQFGQQCLVEPKPGAGGTLAADAVARAKPDGYTLLLATGGHAIAPAMQERLPYDTVKSFQPIAPLTSFGFLVVVPANSPLRKLSDLPAAARSRPQTYGSAGVGTGQHLTGALLMHRAALQATHVPYRGDAASVTAALAGEVDFVVAPATAAVQHVRAGKLRALAISSRQRWSGLPDVPTVAEQGLSGLNDFEVRSWTALFAPAGLPSAMTERLQAGVRTALADATVRQRLEESTGGDISTGSADELRATLVADMQRWTELVRSARIPRE